MTTLRRGHLREREPLAHQALSPPGTIGGGWTEVTHAMSPYTAQPADRKFLVDSTAGPVTINLIPLADETVVIVKDWKGTSAAGGPITVNAPAGYTIEDPANEGNQGPNGLIATQGAQVFWQYVPTSAGKQLIEIV